MNETIEDIIEDITTDATEEVSEENATDEVAPIEETTTPAEEVVTQPEELNIPENWEAPVRDFFGNIEDKRAMVAKIQDPEIRAALSDYFDNGKNALFDKYKSCDDNVQGKFQSAAEQQKAFDAEKQSFEDNRGMATSHKALEEQARAIDGDLFNSEAARMGGTNQYMMSLHQVNSQMANKPLETIQNICQAYNITPDMLANGQQDPQYQARQQEASTQKSMVTMREEVLTQVREEQANAQAQTQANALFTATDDSGNLKYPHLDVIQGDVGMLMEAKQYTVDQAYEVAKSMNPEVFKDEMANQAAEQARQAEVERAKGIRPVKSSPKSVNSSNANQSIDEITAEIMREGGKSLD